MLLKLVRSGECFITFLAGVWFHPSMDPYVPLQVARLEECVITFLAAIRFLLSMDPNVTLQAARLRMFDHIPCSDKVSPQYGS